MFLTQNIETIVNSIVNKPCRIHRVGDARSLSLGFSNETIDTKALSNKNWCGDWQIRTYSAAWRIIQNGLIVVGSSSVVDDLMELDAQVQALYFGKLVSLTMPNKFDLCITLDNATIIDFLSASVDDDEAFHISGPDYLYAEYRCTSGWRVGKSNVPWLQE